MQHQLQYRQLRDNGHILETYQGHIRRLNKPPNVAE